MSKLSFFKIITLGIIKKWKWGVFIITAWVLIVFPCLIEAFPFFDGQNKHEHIKSVPVIIESLSQGIISSAVNRTLWFDVGNEKGKFLGESFFKYGVFPISFLPLNQFHTSFISEACAQGSSSKPSDDGSNRTNNSDTFSGHESVSIQWVIGYIVLLIILMVLSWCAGLGIFYFFT